MTATIIIALGLIITPANSGSEITAAEDNGATIMVQVDDVYECEVSAEGVQGCIDLSAGQDGAGVADVLVTTAL